MWKIFVATVIVVDVGIGTLSWAANKQVVTGDPWMKCYDLGWSRGVHLEMHEMPWWIGECLAGHIPGAPEQSKAGGPDREPEPSSSLPL
jgi:hypothetical protein